MPLESSFSPYISDLNYAWPDGAVDNRSQGDDHLRFIKKALKLSFPNVAGAVTASHTELNYLVGVTANLSSKAESGANSDITSLAGLTTPLSRGQGGTGLSVTGANGNILTSNGTDWQSSPAPVTSFNTRTGAVTLSAADIQAVDGAGSGVDADMLDGVHASSFGGVNSNFDWELVRIWETGAYAAYETKSYNLYANNGPGIYFGRYVGGYYGASTSLFPSLMVGINPWNTNVISANDNTSSPQASTTYYIYKLRKLA